MAEKENQSRFDIIAIKWTRATRKSLDKCQLAIIEMKYGHSAFDNIEKHCQDIISYDKYEELKRTALVQFQQLRDLDLIALDKSSNEKENEKRIQEFQDTNVGEQELELLPERKIEKLQDQIEYIILFANYNSNSTQLKNNWIHFTNAIPHFNAKNINLRFATSNFIGYALYDNSMLSFKQFANKI